MPRFFIADSPMPGSQYLLTGEDARHISRSLRMRTGERLTLCTPDSLDCLCEIREFQDEAVCLEVLTCTANTSEPRQRVTVYQCLPKSDKLETVIQKATELGAAGIVPVESSRCIAKPERSGAQKKLLRLQRIALEAAKQSGRGRVPEVRPAMSLKEALALAAAEGEAILFYELGGMPLRAILQAALPEKPLGIFIGPEGGFTPEEAGIAEEAGARLATLGKRILRTETVAPAVLSIIMYERDELQ